MAGIHGNISYGTFQIEIKLTVLDDELCNSD
jgi:hypothetical protein